MLLLSVLDDLYTTIDADGDGVLSKPEFAKMYKLMKAKMDAEQKAAEDTHVKLTKSQRRGRLLCAGVSMAVPIMLILLLGNMGLVYTMLEMTKEVRTQNDGPDGGTLVDANKHAVKTASVSTSLALWKLPILGETFDYSSLDYVQLMLMGRGKVGFRTIGYHWYNTTDMDVFLERDQTLHITATTRVLAPTVTDDLGLTPIARRRNLQGIMNVDSRKLWESADRRKLFGTAAERTADLARLAAAKEASDKIVDGFCKSKYCNGCCDEQ